MGGPNSVQIGMLIAEMKLKYICKRDFETVMTCQSSLSRQRGRPGVRTGTRWRGATDGSAGAEACGLDAELGEDVATDREHDEVRHL